MQYFAPPPRRDMLKAAIHHMVASGAIVERATDIPGLYYVDNGPELTEMQLIDLAVQRGMR